MARVVACVLVMLLSAGSGVAQTSSSSPSASRDSLLHCASRIAMSAGFVAAPGGTADRLGLMRTRSSPAGTLIDGMRVAVATTGTTPIPALDVRVQTFLSSPSNPFSHQEMPPSKELLALADSVRVRCMRRPI